MEDLITNAHILFDVHSAHQYPPLPPIPAGESVPSYVYGTSHTKVASVPPGSPRLPRTIPPEDFTPRLPPRPANSIHPSSRMNVAPPKERGEVQHPHPPPPSSVTSTLIDTTDNTSLSTSHEAESSSENSMLPTSLQPSSLSTLELATTNEGGHQQTDIPTLPPA